MSVKENGKVVYSKSKAFKKKALATTFGKNAVTELETKGVNPYKQCTIGELIDLYMNDKDLYDKDGRTKRYTIKLLRDCDLSKIYCHELRISNRKYYDDESFR